MLLSEKSRAGEPNGFTLIEMAFVIIVSGLLFAALIRLYGIHLSGKAYRETIDNLDMVEQALGEYYGVYGRYPCPANPDLPPSDPSYGLEQCRANLTDPCPAGLICTNILSRDADGDGAGDPVMIGAIPFQELADKTIAVPFELHHGFDGYDMIISYAVSELMADTSLTVINPANIQLGAIDLRDEGGRDVTDPPSSAHYVIFSHGENKIGAYSRSGESIGGCIVIATGLPPVQGFNPGTPGVETEKENCDNNDAIFVKALQSKSLGDNYYDDILYFGAAGTRSLWRRSLASPPTDTYLYNTNFGNVGVGAGSPVEALHVGGNLKAETETQADSGYCKLTGDGCLLPQALGGSIAGMECPAFEAATGIENNSIICEPVFSGAISFQCSTPGEFVTSFSNLGNVNCAAP